MNRVESELIECKMSEVEVWGIRNFFHLSIIRLLIILMLIYITFV